ncbi:hypothetical protein NKH47_33195 [Mesorhizobium sp. M1060]|uniref:hypothetical protein n=1 Tax=unclassified Mesorhizobium TaxID=325217 RepID=UPI0003CF8428|nr:MULTISPECIES: hypothetical protein [unclassified Mesorhizobium]ESW62755.1 hypothetical protein X771_32480 [Mesorhizobium sp. LSJC277A00]ESW64409.1 hypothetical protein X773_32870 [Mesorhizobium sp. LSJC285A00]ESX09198.1 hypothetical protein X766_33690 [Mesorhizobium sp. LSJC255A00]
MTVISDPSGGPIRLEGDCTLEDSETLLAMLVESGNILVDWRKCTKIHAAVLQVLMAARVRVIGPSGSPFLESYFHRGFRAVHGG